jgi:hypothetical protein
MSPKSLAGRAAPGAFLTLALLTLDAAVTRHILAAEGTSDSATARLALAGHRYAVARAIRGAADQLADARCQELLDEFADVTGRPLRSVLAAHGLAVSDYMKQVFFYDAPEWACRAANLAVTKPGSRAIFVCGARFQKEMSRNSRNAEAIVIHEVLHSLGLGENPPSSDHISARVRALCGQGGDRLSAESPARARP